MQHVPLTTFAPYIRSRLSFVSFIDRLDELMRPPCIVPIEMQYVVKVIWHQRTFIVMYMISDLLKLIQLRIKLVSFTFLAV